MHHEACVQVTIVYSCKLLKLNKISIPCSFFQFSAKQLPTELSIVHDAFHISMLKKYMADPSQADTTYICGATHWDRGHQGTSIKEHDH